jgi:ubiquitin-activating enzyme E1
LCFEELFSNRIKQLLFNYPLDRVTDNGTPFWSGAKKPPTPLVFDISDPTHYEFVLATAEMRCTMFAIPMPQHVDAALVDSILRAVIVPEFRWLMLIVRNLHSAEFSV